MKERPILFSAPMVRAIHRGLKTQTRRAIKPAPVEVVQFRGADDKPTGEYGWCPSPRVITKHIRCPYGVPGDRLWVRESFWSDATTKVFKWYVNEVFTPERKKDHCRLTPGIYMTRKLCRTVLEVTNIRVDRLFAITEEDSRAEGIFKVPRGWVSDEGQPISETARRSYEDLWHSINGAWRDCWVWVVEFERVQ